MSKTSGIKHSLRTDKTFQKISIEIIHKDYGRKLPILVVISF